MALPRFLLRPSCPATLKTRTRASIDYLLGDTDPELVYVRAVAPARTFTPELNQTRENMAISAEFDVHYARMEVEGQPHTGWPANLRNAKSSLQFKLRFGHVTRLVRVATRIRDTGIHRSLKAQECRIDRRGEQLPVGSSNSIDKLIYVARRSQPLVCLDGREEAEV
ncbi:hypothetical protein PI125_g66 [Phytophthora idaei]|nr:hypothetical protein PI125_g66 [Phytophthora idaei]